MDKFIAVVGLAFKLDGEQVPAAIKRVVQSVHGLEMRYCPHQVERQHLVVLEQVAPRRSLFRDQAMTDEVLGSSVQRAEIFPSPTRRHVKPPAIVMHPHRALSG